jgi:serine/threonine protein kinase
LLSLYFMYNTADFRILSTLGSARRRKFNAVYLVEHETLPVQAVLKHLRKTDQNEHLVPLLRQESLFSFDQPGLPKTLAYSEDETEIRLIRAYQPGIPLDIYWKKRSRKQQLPFIADLLQALAPLFRTLQQQQIVHADIKPGNILVHTTDKGIEVQLIDFGMAFQRSNVPERGTLFSLGYAAPEIILNRLHLADQSTDLFALGIVIWQLFNGKLPLTHANPAVMTNLQLTYPLDMTADIPKILRPVLAKMCHKHRFQLPPNRMELTAVDHYLQEAIVKRYKSMEELATDLQTLLTQKSGWKQRLVNVFSKSKVEGKNQR